MQRIDTKILFRPSGLGQIMTNAQGKSNAQKYEDALEKKGKADAKYKEASQKYIEAVDLRKSLEIGKDDHTVTRKGSKTPAEKYQDAVLKEAKANEALNISIEKDAEAQREVDAAFLVKDHVNLSATCKKYLKTMHIKIRWKREKRLKNKEVKKGLAVEEGSIRIYSEWSGEYLENNKIRKQNDYFDGEYDLKRTDAKGERVTKITDIKSRFDIDTFEDHRDEEATDRDKEQLQGYCDLEDADEASIANVLTNNDFGLIMDEIKREAYQFKPEELGGNFEIPLWRAIEIAKNSIFDEQGFDEFLNEYCPSDIYALSSGKHHDEEAQAMYDSFVEVELDDRVIEVSVARDRELIQAIKKRCDECRKYMADKYNIHHVE